MNFKDLPNPRFAISSLNIMATIPAAVKRSFLLRPDPGASVSRPGYRVNVNQLPDLIILISHRVLRAVYDSTRRFMLLAGQIVMHSRQETGYWLNPSMKMNIHRRERYWNANAALAISPGRTSQYAQMGTSFAMAALIVV